MYDIMQYFGGRDDEIAALILSIQNDEAGLDLSIADQPDLQDIAASYRSGGSGSRFATGKWSAPSDYAVTTSTVR